MTPMKLYFQTTDTHSELFFLAIGGEQNRANRRVITGLVICQITRTAAQSEMIMSLCTVSAGLVPWLPNQGSGLSKGSQDESKGPLEM